MSLEIGGWFLTMIAAGNGAVLLGPSSAVLLGEPVNAISDSLCGTLDSTIILFAVLIVWHVVILWIYILLVLPNWKFLSNKLVSWVFKFFSYALSLGSGVGFLTFYDEG